MANPHLLCQSSRVAAACKEGTRGASKVVKEYPKKAKSAMEKAYETYRNGMCQ